MTDRKFELSGSNCEAIVGEGNRLELRFAGKDGTISASRWEFESLADLVDHLARTLSMNVVGGQLRGKIVCKGKYKRAFSEAGRATRTFTFGDPILDLITNPVGEVSIGGRTVDFSSFDLASARDRSGGIQAIDMKHLSDATPMLLGRVAMGLEPELALVECSEDVIEVASTNPSKRDYYRGGDQMRFRAWRKSKLFYWSMGAEVETWGHDFRTARIDSRYLDTVFGDVCAILKTDSDSDSNDNYLDEYEWGVNAPQPRRVVSRCSANWYNTNYTAQVEAGQSCALETW